MPPKLVIEVLGDVSHLEKAFKRASRSSQGFERSLGQSARGAVAASLSFRGLGRAVAFSSAAFLGGAGFTAAITSTISKAAAFEKSLNVLQAVSHATAGEMRKVSAEAKRLGADISLPSTSAKDAAEAMLELSKANLSVTDTMAAARGSLQLAAAANVTAGEAAAIAARQLNAFELAGKEASRVADVLANAANSATGGIGDFAIAFQQSATIAHRFGLTVEDTAASLAVMANAGLVGSDAGTSLRVMLGRLVPQTKKASELMADLGIKWQDANGNIIPFRQQLVQYQAVLEKLNPAQRQQALFTLFGSDAQRAANIILTRGVDAYDRMLKAVSRQGGAARLAAAQNKGFTGALDALKSALETTQITLGTMLLPTLTQYTRAGAKWLGDTKNQARIQRDFKEALATTGEVLKTVLVVVRDTAAVFGKFSELVGGAKNAIEGLAAAVVAVKIAGLVAGFTATGTAAAGATTKVALLRSQLRALSLIAPIVIGVEIVTHAKGISEAGNKWLRKNGLGFLAGGTQADMPSVASLQAAIKSGGFNAQVAKALLAKMPSSTDQTSIEALRGTFEAEVGRGGFKGFTARGTAGGATAGAAGRRLPGAPLAPLKALGLGAFIPKSLELAAAMARTEAQERTVAGEKLAVINKRLRGRLAVDDRIALEQEKTSILAGLRSMNEAEASERKSASEKAKAAATKAITDRVAAVARSIKDTHLGVKGGPLSVGQVNKAMAGRETSFQFRALGLTAEGGERAPTIKGLKAALGNLEGDVKGTALDSAKMRSKFAVMRKLIGGEFGKVREDVRRTIKGMLDDIDGQLDKNASRARVKHLSSQFLAKQFTAGLGLSTAEFRAIRQNISGAHLTGRATAAGGGHSRIDLHSHVSLDGREIGRSVRKDAAKTQHRTARQTSGWNRG